MTTISAPDGTFFWSDPRFFPMVSVRLIGKTTVPLTTTFGNWLCPLVDYAATQGQKVIIVNDVSRSSVPGARARKIMAADADRLQASPGFGYWVPVVPDPILRGVLTAVVWMVRDHKEQKRTVYATSLRDAIEKTLRLYGSMDHSLPDVDPDSYRFPEPGGRD